MSTFSNRAFSSENNGTVLNNVQYDKKLLREAIASGDWEGSTVEVNPAQAGYITINSGATGVVKRVTIPETGGTTNFRAAYMLDADADGVYGQQIGPVADKSSFLYQDIEIAEQRTARFAEHSNRQKRLGYNTLSMAGGSLSMAQEQVKRSVGRQVNHDHWAGLINGGCDVLLAPATQQGLELNIGGVTASDNTTAATVAGSRALHENFIGFDTSGGTTVTSAMDVGNLRLNTAAGRQSHEDNMATCLAGMQAVMRGGTTAEQAKMFLTKDSIKGLRYWATKWNIQPIMGADYDFEFRVDWEVAEALVGTLSGSENDTLVAILKLMAQGNGNTSPLLDTRQKRLVLDGVLITPSRHLQGWRPASIGTTVDGGRIVYASDASAGVATAGTTDPSGTGYWKEGNKRRAYESNNGKVGLGFLLGDSALIHATDGALKVTREDGAHETGAEFQGHTWRTIGRSIWTGKDPATSTQLRNESSIQCFFGVPQNLGAL